MPADPRYLIGEMFDARDSDKHIRKPFGQHFDRSKECRVIHSSQQNDALYAWQHILPTLRRSLQRVGNGEEVSAVYNQLVELLLWGSNNVVRIS